MFDRWYQRADVLIIVSVAGMLIMGFLALYSTSASIPQSSGGLNYFQSQLIWFFMGLIALVVALFIPPRIYADYSYGIYGLTLILLLAVLLINGGGNGARRWLNLGFMHFQPSELAKISVLLAVANYLGNSNVDLNKFKNFFVVTTVFFLPVFLLILKQPDLGTALVFLVLILPVFYWAGLRGGNIFLYLAPLFVLMASFNFYFFLIAMLIIVAYLYFSKRSLRTGAAVFLINIFVGLITPVLWNNLREYQQQRIKIFLTPEADPLGAGYQIIQSKVAIGSGGFFGKGFLNGTQTQLRFLPEQHTDFIFAVVGEEFGFLGVVIGLLLFTIFLINAVKIANMQRSKFNGIVAIGIATLIGFHMMVNIGMTIGLLPVTGLPLPFISYGGSAMVINLSMVGLLLNFYRHRYEY
jgi:rod shape determining protein RodA